MYMRKENGKRESPYKGILKFADEKKPQLSLPLSCLFYLLLLVLFHISLWRFYYKRHWKTV